MVLIAVLALLAGAPALAEPTRSEGSNWSAELALAPETDADPALAGALRSSAEAALSAFKGWAAADPEASHPYEFSLGDSATFVSDRWISVIRSIYAYTGGAHGNVVMEPRLWDREARRFVGIEALLSDASPGAPGLAALSDALRAGIADKVYGGAVDPFWAEDVEKATSPDPAALSNFTLAPSAQAGRAAALDFHYSPYAIAAYVQGTPVIRIDWRVIEPHLSEAGKALFGGEPAAQ